MTHEWRPERVIDEDLAARTVASQFPELAHLPVRQFDAGWDNAVFLVGDDLLFRFVHREIALDGSRRELAVLRSLAPLPLPVPRPVHVGIPTTEVPWPFWGARMLPGRGLAESGLAPDRRGAVAETVGEFLRALHDHPPVAGLPVDPIRRADPARQALRAEQRLSALAALGGGGGSARGGGGIARGGGGSARGGGGSARGEGGSARGGGGSARGEGGSAGAGGVGGSPDSRTAAASRTGGSGLHADRVGTPHELGGLAADLLAGSSALRAAASQAPPGPGRVLVHGDLHVRHVLVVQDRPSGVIDWGDTAVGDPSVDLMVAWAAFDPEQREQLLAAYGPIDAATRLRARATALHVSATLAHQAAVDGHAAVLAEALAGVARAIAD